MLKMNYHKSFICAWVLVITAGILAVYRESQVLIDWNVDMTRTDFKDVEWQMFKNAIPVILLQNAAQMTTYYIQASNIVRRYIVYTVSCCVLLHTFGLNGMIFLVIVTCVYWLAILKINLQATYWFSLGLIILIEKIEKVLGLDFPNLYYVHQCTYLHILKMTSFSFDCFTDKRKVSCLEMLDYFFYAPVQIFGPTIGYNDYLSLSKGNNQVDYKLLWKCISVFFVIEVLSFILPFRLLSEYVEVHHILSPLAVFGCLYMNGVYFFLKYYVMYGAAAALVGDGKICKPPCCTCYIYRYSKLWQQFDLGIYLFIKRYIYNLVLTRSTFDISSEWKRSCAIVVSFLFVALWHGGSKNMFAWALLNLLAFKLEDATTTVYKKMNIMIPRTRLFWIKSLVYLPSTVFSILINAIICSSYTTAASFACYYFNSSYNLMSISTCFYIGTTCSVLLEKRLNVISKAVSTF